MSGVLEKEQVVVGFFGRDVRIETSLHRSEGRPIKQPVNTRRGASAFDSVGIIARYLWKLEATRAMRTKKKLRSWASKKLWLLFITTP